MQVSTRPYKLNQVQTTTKALRSKIVLQVDVKKSTESLEKRTVSVLNTMSSTKTELILVKMSFCLHIKGREG